MREFIIPFATGITLFLFGMQMLRIGLYKASGNHLQYFLYKFTKTPYHGFFSGTVATIFLQSSSAVTILTIGLINANLITFYQTIGIVLGTNIGTVVTAELIAINIDKWGGPILILGLPLIFIPKKKIKAIGLIISGFAIIFFGMNALRSISLFIEESSLTKTILSFDNYQILIGLLFGIIITSIIQSSSVTTAITMSMVYNTGIPLIFGIAIILGSNIGTCFTAILASIGGSTEGKQVAMAHVLLNVIGVILFLPFINSFSAFVEGLTSYPPAQIAHSQLIFNLVISLIVLPFAKPFSHLTILLTPGKVLN